MSTAAKKLAREVMGRWKSKNARERAIAILERAAEYLRETDEAHGRRVDIGESQRLQDKHDCKEHSECGHDTTGCRFYVLTTVGFCEHCGELPDGSVGYIDAGTSWCIGCGQGLVDEGPTVQS